MWKIIALTFHWKVCSGLLTHHVTINTETSIHVVNERFLSVAIDFGVVRSGFDLYDLRHPRLLTLTRALAPAVLRLGGTPEDFMTFEPDGVFHDSVHTFAENYLLDRLDWMRDQHPFNMTGRQLDSILEFKLNTDLELFIGLNVLKRNGQAWDPTNIEVLFDYVTNRNVLVHWQLGNEPPFGKFNVTVEPQQLADDFRNLHNLMSRYPLFRSSLLVGPDIGQLEGKKKKMSYFDTYIRYAVPVLNAVTWHMYYLDGRTATLNDFINPDILDKLINETFVITKLTRNYSPNLPIWLGETSSTYGGGTKGLSDSYVAGFMWLDKLGLSARNGIDVVIRQTLFSGHYSLLEDHDFIPRPDYWLSLLYKLLVGRKVLDVKVSSNSRLVRVYAHCSNERSAHYPRGNIVIFALNLQKEPIELVVDKLGTTIAFDQFVLTPENADLKSRAVLLNGQKLEMPDERTLPNLQPFLSDRIELPALSFGFFVVRGVIVEACL